MKPELTFPMWLRVAFPLSLSLSLALGILSFLSAAHTWSIAFYLSVFPLTMLNVYGFKLRAFPPAPRTIRGGRDEEV